MKIRFKPKIHNCDKHLETKTWRDDYSIVEELTECKICKRVKYHWAYGTLFYENWKEPKIKK